jgi:thioredoxin-related protein
MSIKIITGCILAFLMLSFTNDEEYSNNGTNFRENINVFRVSKILDKPVMVYIGADYCQRSQRMEAIFLNKEVGCFLNEHFICKKFKAENPFHVLRANNWGITDVPSYVFFNSNGKVVYSCSGFRDAEQIVFEAKRALAVMQKEFRNKHPEPVAAN